MQKSLVLAMKKELQAYAQNDEDKLELATE